MYRIEPPLTAFTLDPAMEDQILRSRPSGGDLIHAAFTLDPDPAVIARGAAELHSKGYFEKVSDQAQ